MSFRWKKLLCALAVVALAGVLRLKPEQAYTQMLRDQRLQEPPPSLALRSQLGQSFYLAVFGGFRSLVASLTEVESVTAWQHYNYGKVDACYAICCELQPRELHYWDFRYWMLAKNASHYFRYVDESRRAGGVDREINQRYVEKGIKVLEDAIPWVGDDWHLWRTLGDAYSDFYYNNKLDWGKAAAAYERGSKLPGALRHMWKMHVFAVARIKGRELEAWDKLMALYNSPDKTDRVPTVISLLCVLEPEVRALRPVVKLPPELEENAAKVRAEWKKRQDKIMHQGPATVESPNLKQTEPGK